MKRMISSIVIMAVLLTGLCSCVNKKDINPNLNLNEQVTLTVVGAWTSFKALENASQAFYDKYPNCEIRYEYLQNYETNVVTRLENSPDSIDIFFSGNIQATSPTLMYAEDLFSHKELDLTDTNEALIKNYTYFEEGNNEADKIYAIPFGGEVRGLYVNKTLLSSLNISVPTDITELFEACRVLKDAGYVPMNGNPYYFSQRLLYPYVCNIVANDDNYEDLYNRINSCEAGVSELFREPLKVMYDLTANYYYNYKYVETEYNMFTDNSNEGIARDFFNIKEENGEPVKKDDVGTVAFVSGSLTQQTTMDKIKEDYHSNIEYEFILSPVGEDGGFAYVSPTSGFAVNKNSTHMDWAIEFLNFLFEKEENIQFNTDCHFIPNVKDSFGVIRELYDIPANHVSDLGQMTFDYSFYNIIVDALTQISKANNPKYMDKDADGNPVMYSFDYYMNQLEEKFAAQRNSGAN